MMKTSPEKKFWFPAKKHGIGWGWPTCWQGCVVCVAYVALVTTGTLGLSAIFPGGVSATLWMALVLAVLMPIPAVIWGLKGPKFRWHRGDEDEGGEE